jgi:glycosyltransferase involved in cell wall biosynthesis
MNQLLTMLQKYPLMGLIRRALFVLRGRVVTLNPKGAVRGRMLLSFITPPFTFLDRSMYGGHSNYWGARDIADTFLERGYIVDVIDFDNTTFIPIKSYDYFIDVGTNMGRIAPLLPPTCIKMCYATASYWEFQNNAEDARIAAIHARRGAVITPRRHMPPSPGIEQADIISGVCGPFPASTYAHFGKPIRMVTVTATHEFPFPEDKDFAAARTQFVWFGGSGAAHKGLDLVLEAFVRMPEYTLIVCGKFEGEQDFVNAYKTELYNTPNIHAVGYINPDGEEFLRIMNASVGVISASCAEGCATSVVLAMGTGVLPLVNKETGVGVGDFGIMLEDSSVDAIRRAVASVAFLSPAELKGRAKKAWDYVHDYHSKARVGHEFRAVVDELEKHRTNAKESEKPSSSHVTHA